MAEQTLSLKLTFPGEQPTVATAKAREWTMLERVRRAIFGMALCWIGAGLFLPIPGVHLVLPPLLLLAGPVLFYFRISEKLRLTSMKGSCPRCKVERDFELDLRFTGKRSFTCDGCGNLIEMEPASG